jgi:metal-dependent amidase/aminoacylase/carboxypeptidase family protein
VTFNNHELADQMRPVLEAVAGEGRVLSTRPVTGAEDFSFFAERVPGMYIALGGRSSDISEDEAPGHHTPEFRIDESGLLLGVKAMTAMALEYMGAHAAAQ